MTRSAQGSGILGPDEIGEAKLILGDINWSFSSPFSVGRSGISLFDCRKYHWFPATFIPDIPHTLIEVLSRPGAVVYDPFAGIGTTVFQALLLGRRPHATEVCSVAVAFSRSLWTLLGPQSTTNQIEKELSGFRDDYDPAKDYTSLTFAKPGPRVEALRPWFSPPTFNEVTYLMHLESGLRNPARAAATIVLSSILKAVCAQDKGWGCVADNVLPKRDQLKNAKSALDRFDRNMRTLLRDLSALKRELSPDACRILSSTPPESCILQIDARLSEASIPEPVDLIVTSPPYPNMTDYALSQRLSYYWMGSDPSHDLAREIGARRKRFQSTSVSTYLQDMTAAMDSFSSALRSGGYACLVMPAFDSNNGSNPVRRKAVEDCMSYLPSKGFVHETTLHRLLPSRRRHHNQTWTSLEKECIYVFRKVS